MKAGNSEIVVMAMTIKSRRITGNSRFLSLLNSNRLIS